MTEPFLSQIMLVAFNFPPKGWVTCSGQLLAINQNQALFSLIGTTYGGNGVTTFGLPNLNSRIAIGNGNHTIGEQGGAETVSLSTSHMPFHQHAINPGTVAFATRCYSGPGNQRTPVGNVPAVEASAVTATYSNSGADAVTSTSAMQVTANVGVGIAGQGLPHENRQPYLALMYCIAINAGVFPSQN